MEKQRIPRVTPDMIRNQPDQLSDILNRVIDILNNL